MANKDLKRCSILYKPLEKYRWKHYWGYTSYPHNGLNKVFSKWGEIWNLDIIVGIVD